MKVRHHKLDSKEKLWSGKQGNIRIQIIQILLKEGKLKLNELQERLGDSVSSRGSLKFHLKKLEQFDYILPMKRAENEYGRPTYLEVNKKQLKKEREEFDNKINEYRNKMNTSPLKEKILNLLQERKELSAIEIHKIIKKDNQDLMISEVLSMLSYLEIHKKVKNVWKIRK